MRHKSFVHDVYKIFTLCLHNDIVVLQKLLVENLRAFTNASISCTNRSSRRMDPFVLDLHVFSKAAQNPTLQNLVGVNIAPPELESDDCLDWLFGIEITVVQPHNRFKKNVTDVRFYPMVWIRAESNLVNWWTKMDTRPVFDLSNFDPRQLK